MTNLDPVDNAIENIITLANCWLTLLPGYDCGTTNDRVEEVVYDVLAAVTDGNPMDKAAYHALMHKASFLLRDWLKFEHQVKPLIESGFNPAVKISVAELKDAPKSCKFHTPWPFRMSADPATRKKLPGVVFKIPAGHLMARCMNLEVRFALFHRVCSIDFAMQSSPINATAICSGDITVDKHGKVTAFRHHIDLARMLATGKEKFEDALVEYIQASVALDPEA